MFLRILLEAIRIEMGSIYKENDLYKRVVVKKANIEKRAKDRKTILRKIGKSPKPPPI